LGYTEKKENPIAANDNTQIDEEEEEPVGKDKWNRVIFDKDEKPFTQTKDNQSIYSMIERFGQLSVSGDPFESNVPPRTKWKKVGKRVFQENELLQQAIWDEGPLEPIFATEQGVTTKFAEQIGNAEKKVKVKIIRKIHVKKKMTKKQ